MYFSILLYLCHAQTKQKRLEQSYREDLDQLTSAKSEMVNLKDEVKSLNKTLKSKDDAASKNLKSAEKDGVAMQTKLRDELKAAAAKADALRTTAAERQTEMRQQIDTLHGSVDSTLTEVDHLRSQLRGEQKNTKNYIQFVKAMHREVFQSHQTTKLDDALLIHDELVN